MRTNDNGIDRDMTEEELADYEILTASNLARAKAEAKAEAAKEAARSAVLTKLGLTAEEAQALLS